MSSSSRRLSPISWGVAFRLSVGVGNSGKDNGDCGDVSSPDRSSSAVPPPATRTQKHTPSREQRGPRRCPRRFGSDTAAPPLPPTCLLLCAAAVDDLALHLLLVQVDDLGQAVVGLQDLGCGRRQGGREQVGEEEKNLLLVELRQAS